MKSFIIQVEYGGLGDHLFYSHLPRIAKESGIDEVLISTRSVFRNADIMNLVWGTNPHVNGTADAPGYTFRGNPHNIPGGNVLDSTMLDAGFDNGIRYNEPELYYKPDPLPGIGDIAIYDPNWISRIGSITPDKIRKWLQDNGHTVDMELQHRNSSVSLGLPQYPTSDLRFLCRIIASCRAFYCLVSGSSVLCRALGRKAVVFAGHEIGQGFMFSKENTYAVL